MVSKLPDVDDFDEFDLETGNHLVVIVYNEDDDNLCVENPSQLSAFMVRGLLEEALDSWRDQHSMDWVPVDGDDDERR